MTDTGMKSPILYYSIGSIFLLALITGCESKKTPVEVTQGFWSDIIANQLDSAKQYCSAPSQQLPAIQDKGLTKDSFSYGKIVIEGGQATVDAKIGLSSGKKRSVLTHLVKLEDGWKVDCNRTSAGLNGNQTLNDFFNDLNELGENFSKQLKQQLPVIEKEIETFSNQLKEQLPVIEKELESFNQNLKQQMEELGDELKKSIPKKPIETDQETI